MANIPKKWVFSTLIAFSIILLSQEKIFADLTDPTPPASSSTESQAQNTETLQIEPNPIAFQVGIDTTNFDTVNITFGGVDMSSLALFVDPEMDEFISEDDQDIGETMGTLYFPPFPKDSRPPPPPEDEFGA